MTLNVFCRTKGKGQSVCATAKNLRMPWHDPEFPMSPDDLYWRKIRVNQIENVRALGILNLGDIYVGDEPAVWASYKVLNIRRAGFECGSIVSMKCESCASSRCVFSNDNEICLCF